MDLDRHNGSIGLHRKIGGFGKDEKLPFVADMQKVWQIPNTSHAMVHGLVNFEGKRHHVGHKAYSSE